MQLAVACVCVGVYWDINLSAGIILKGLPSQPDTDTQPDNKPCPISLLRRRSCCNDGWIICWEKLLKLPLRVRSVKWFTVESGEDLVLCGRKYGSSVGVVLIVSVKRAPWEQEAATMNTIQYSGRGGSSLSRLFDSENKYMQEWKGIITFQVNENFLED